MSDILELGKKRAGELLGCLVHFGTPGVDNPGYYRANDIHELLGEGVEVFVAGWHSHERSHSVTDAWSTNYWPVENAKEQALLIGIKPIVQESEERKLLREFVKHWKDTSKPLDMEWHQLIAETERLLDGEK